MEALETQETQDLGDEEYRQAAVRGQEAFRTEPRAIRARFDVDSNRILIDLNKGYSIAFAPQRSQALHNATPEQLQEIEIDYPGFSLYFPKLDDGLLIAAAIQGRFGNDAWEQAWAEAQREAHAA